MLMASSTVSGQLRNVMNRERSSRRTAGVQLSQNGKSPTPILNPRATVGFEGKGDGGEKEVKGIIEEKRNGY